MWKTIKGFERYSISDDGKVRRDVPYKSTKVGTIIKQWLNTYGYPCVSLRNIEHKNFRLSVHKLVLNAFVGPPPLGMQCNHKDGNKLNNQIDNLEWVTVGENIRHAVKLGLNKAKRGVESKLSKFKKRDIEWIRMWSELGYFRREIGEAYHVSRQTIDTIVNGERYAEI